MSITHETRVRLWDAINRYAQTCGGDPSKHVYGNIARMNAVVDVEQVLRDAAPEEPERTPEVVLRAMLAAYEAAWVARVDAVIAEGKSPLFDKRQAWLERAITQLRWEYMGAAARADYQPFVTGTGMRPGYDARLTGKLPLNAPPMEV